MKLPAHYILPTISYSRDFIECACGWSGKAKDGLDWAEHRRVHALRSKHRGEGIKAMTVVPGWERSR